MMLKRRNIALLCTFASLFFAAGDLAWAFKNNAEIKPQHQPISQPLEALKDVGVTEKLGSKISLNDLKFTDEHGIAVPLKTFFDGKKPVLLTLTYYRCANLCSILYNGILEGLKRLDWTPGNQFEIVNVTIDPKETPKVAAEKLDNYLKAYGRPESKKGWHFLTGEQSQITKLAEQVGFKYTYDSVQDQFGHVPVVFVITPDGTIARNLYGIQFTPADLKLALLEATRGKIGNVIEKVMMYCYRYDSTSRGYSFLIGRVLQGSAVVTLILLGSFLGLLWRRQRGVITHV